MAESNNRKSEEDPVHLEVSVEFLKREHQECVICATDPAECFDIQKTYTSHCILLHAFLFKHTNVNFDSEGDRYMCKICLDLVNELEQAELEYVKLKHSFELIISKNPLFHSLEKMSLKKLKFSSDRDELSEKFNDEKDSCSTIMKLEAMSDEDKGKEVESEPDGPKTRQKQTMSAKPPAIGGAAPRKQITVKKGKGKMRKSSEKHPITSEKYQCVICQRQFSQKGNYNRHLTTHSGVMPYECPTCQRRFNRKDHLLTHIRTHTGEKPYECNFCLVKFNQKGSIIKHLRTHTGQEPFECNMCHRRFKQRPHLNSHLRSHTGEKPYECNYCKRRFIESSKLKIHLRTHTGERPYGCTYCNRQFNQSGNLQSHLRTHTGEKPYECVMCQRRFNLKHHLRDHLSSHTGEKAFECNVCKQRFNYKHVMQKHMKVMHHPMVCPSYEIAMNAEPEIIIKVDY